MARQFHPHYADAVARGRVPFPWLCGPSGVGKSAVGYEIFQQVRRSGIKASFMDFDQLGTYACEPADGWPQLTP
jgi:adenylylsulfate kinase-like enzyme